MNHQHEDPQKTDRIIYGILLSVAMILAYVYFFSIHVPREDLIRSSHNAIILGTAKFPYRYRVLVPFVMEGLSRLLSPFFADFSFTLAYGIYYLFALFGLLLTLYIFLRHWFIVEHALIGCLFAASAAHLGLRDSYFQPWSQIEPTLLMLALLATYKKRYVLIGVLVLLATLNRETGAFLVIAFVVANTDFSRLRQKKFPVDLKTVLLTAAYSAVWLLTYGGLRLIRGGTPPIVPLAELLDYNLRPGILFWTALNLVTFFGFFWIFIVRGFKFAPPFIRRAALLVPIYFIILAPYAIWYEVRLLMPLFGVLIPLGLSYLFKPVDEQPPLDNVPAPVKDEHNDTQ
jgi:hypothetical protein